MHDAAHQDDAVFEELVLRYEKSLYRFAYRFLRDENFALDAVQETFVKAWQNMHTFKVGRTVRPWLFAICRNTALDFLKKKKDIPFSSFETEQETNILTDSLEDVAIPVLEGLQAQELVEYLLSDISLVYRDVVLLHYTEGFTFDEIATMLHKPLDTVKSQHRRALLALRERARRAPK